MAFRQVPPVYATNRPVDNHDSRSSTPTSTTPPPTVRQQRTTAKPLNFQHSMKEFSTMFPELDRDVIETVLRANNGVVQTTIDQLLELQESTISEKAVGGGSILPSYESSIGDGEEPPPAYNDIWEDVGAPLPDPLFPNSKNAKRNNNVGFNNKRKEFPRNNLWNAPLVGELPEDFLRLNIKSVKSDNTASANNGATGVGNSEKDFMTDDDVERFLEDEKLAMFLQNEEFLRELRRNREFVTSLEADHQQAVIASGGEVQPTPSTTASGGARPRTTPSQEDAQFRQKLKHMGKSTRKKFGKMAKKFSRSKTAGKQPYVMSSSESTFNLLGDDEFEDEKSIHHLREIKEEDHIENNIEETPERETPRSDDFTLQRPRPRPSVKTPRQLPTPPGAPTNNNQNNLIDEPIVFYGEDNEFALKNE